MEATKRKNRSHRPPARELIYWTVGAAVLALLVRTWLVLGLVAPVTVAGSSMAPTLLGPHRLYRCPGCDLEFSVGLDQLPADTWATCPECRRVRAQAMPHADRRGDRLLVDRTAYWWAPPRRWDVVVFRCPERSDRFCVKRIVGLPGEHVTLERGDLFVDGQIVRKNFEQQQALRQLVHRETAASRRWRPQNQNSGKPSIGENQHARDLQTRGDPTGGWRWRDGAWRYRSVHSNQIAWLGYRHPDEVGFTDDLSYNQRVTRQLNRVMDVMITMRVRTAGQGLLLLTARVDEKPLVLQINPSSKRVCLWHGSALLADQSLRTTRSLQSDGVDLAFSLFDRQALLAINGDEQLAVPWPRTGRGPSASKLEVSIGVRGLAVEIAELAVWRDAYFHVRRRDWAVWKGRLADRAGSESPTQRICWPLAADEYFVLGDNGAISDDSRSWQHGPGVEAKSLVGQVLGVR